MKLQSRKNNAGQQHEKLRGARPFKEKESYRWVEALTKIEKKVSTSTRVIHVFDASCASVAEVFDAVRQLQHTGVLVRAAHNRSLDAESERLWQFLESQSIGFEQDIHLPETATRKARQAKLAVRFGPVQLRTPYRFEHREPLKVHAVYATEVDCPLM